MSEQTAPKVTVKLFSIEEHELRVIEAMPAHFRQGPARAIAGEVVLLADDLELLRSATHRLCAEIRILKDRNHELGWKNIDYRRQNEWLRAELLRRGWDGLFTPPDEAPTEKK